MLNRAKEIGAVSIIKSMLFQVEDEPRVGAPQTAISSPELFHRPNHEMPLDHTELEAYCRNACCFEDRHRHTGNSMRSTLVPVVEFEI